MRSRRLCQDRAYFPLTCFHPPSPRQFCCKIAVAVTIPELNFGKPLLVPVNSQALGLLCLVITEVPFDLDFGEINLLSCEASATAISR